MTPWTRLSDLSGSRCRVVNELIGLNKSRRGFLFFSAMCALLWPLIPSLVVTVWFYFVFFMAPLDIGECRGGGGVG